MLLLFEVLILPCCFLIFQVIGSNLKVIQLIQLCAFQANLLIENIIKKDSCAHWFDPLHAKFFRGNINIYLHFMALLNIDMTQVLKILPQVRPGPTYST